MAHRAQVERAGAEGSEASSIYVCQGISIGPDDMRTVTFGAACSLDGFIARPDHSVDWLRWSRRQRHHQRVLEDDRHRLDGAQDV